MLEHNFLKRPVYLEIGDWQPAFRVVGQPEQRRECLYLVPEVESESLKVIISKEKITPHLSHPTSFHW